MKSVKYHNLTEKEALEYTSNLVDFGAALLVFSALNELLNAYTMLSQSKYFHHTVKRRAKEALKQRNRKEKAIVDIVKHKGFAETYWDAAIDACENDVATLRAELKATLDKAGTEDSDLFSQTETTRIMLHAAKIHFEEVIKEATNKFRTKNWRDMQHLNLFATFSEFYVGGIYHEWDTVCEELYDGKESSVDLNNERTMAAFNILAEKFAKGLYIDECLKVAQAEYPDFKELRVKVKN